MLSRSLFLPAAASLASPALASVLSASALECPADAPVSCQNDGPYDDTCCFNAPGGQMLLTQFWDTKPATGPADSWTVHGLWYPFPFLMSSYTT